MSIAVDTTRADKQAPQKQHFVRLTYPVFVTCSHVSQCPVELFTCCNDGRFLSRKKKIGKHHPLSYCINSIRIIDNRSFDVYFLFI